MDKQIALMKKLQKDPDTIAYAHCDEIILIKREAAEDGSAVLVEITINIDTEKATAKRSILDSEMQLSDFDAMKKLLTDHTTEEFNADWRITHRDVDLEKLENTDTLCLPSVEEEYIEQFEGEEDYRTLENAMNLLLGVLLLDESEPIKRCQIILRQMKLITDKLDGVAEQLKKQEAKSVDFQDIIDLQNELRNQMLALSARM